MVDDNNKHKKEKTIKKNIVRIISQNKCKEILLSNKCLIHSINRIQIKDCRTGAYEINNISFFALMIKYTSKTMDIADLLLVIKVSYEKQVS